MLCRQHPPGAPRREEGGGAAGGPGRAVPGARRGCRGGGAGRSAARRAAAGSQGREGPAAGDFMRRRRRRWEVGLVFLLPVPSAGRARGGRCAGHRGRGTAETESGGWGGGGRQRWVDSLPPFPLPAGGRWSSVSEGLREERREQVRAATPPPAAGLRAAGGPVPSAQVGPAAAVSLPAAPRPQKFPLRGAAGGRPGGSALGRSPSGQSRRSESPPARASGCRGGDAGRAVGSAPAPSPPAH